MRRFDLPGVMAAGEIAGFVELQLEELSPFLLDQLYYGRAVSADGGAVFVYAAYRRRFLPEQTKDWSARMFVLPEFAGLLHLRFEKETVVLFRSGEALTVFLYEGGKSLPVAGASRALPTDVGEEEIQRFGQKLIGLVGGADADVISLRPGKLPEQRPQGLRFVFLRADNSEGKPMEVTVPSAECWQMDIREASFVAQQRRRLGVDLIFWRGVIGIAALLALLLVGEILLLMGRGYSGWLASRVERQAEEAVALEDKDSIALRVSEFDRSDMQPIDMIAAVGGKKPTGVVFIKATVGQGNTLEFDATTANVAEVNSFEAALRSVPEIDTVEVSDIRTRAEGTTFTITVKFSSGAFAPAPEVAGAPPAPSGGGK